MRKLLFFLCIAPLLAGCVTTEGTFIRDMDAKEPYHFTYDGPSEDAIQNLKRTLVGQGWNVRDEDVDAGVIAAIKSLADDEKVSTTGFTEAMVGAGTGGQVGRLAFTMTEGESVTKVLMRSEVVVAVNEQQAFSTEQSKETATPQRGHPLMVKTGLQIDDIEGFELTDPSSSRLRRARQKN